MKLFQVGLSLVFLVGSELSAFAQSSIITTYAGRGPALPASGAQATTQAIVFPVSVIPDACRWFLFRQSQSAQNIPSGCGWYADCDCGNRDRRASAETAARRRRPAQRPARSGGGCGRQSVHRRQGQPPHPQGYPRRRHQHGGGQRRPMASAATAALLLPLSSPWPSGVAVDGAGNLFIADTGNHRIRKVTPAGIISTVAGTGNEGFSGDGGPATAAQLRAPAGVAVDGAGNLFIADVTTAASARSTQPVSSARWPGRGIAGLQRRRRPGNRRRTQHPRVSRWMERAICSSPTLATPASAR